MQKVNTFDAAFDASKTADDRAARVAGLGRAIRSAWARLLELRTRDYAVGSMRLARRLHQSTLGSPRASIRRT